VREWPSDRARESRPRKSRRPLRSAARSTESQPRSPRGVPELANRRAGTATRRSATSPRARRKPWKQKGTGRRAGFDPFAAMGARGVVFRPPRTYVSASTRRSRRAAMVAALTTSSQRRRPGGSTRPFDVTKTKALATLLFGSPNAAKTGADLLVVFADRGTGVVGRRYAAPAATCSARCPHR